MSDEDYLEPGPPPNMDDTEPEPSFQDYKNQAEHGSRAWNAWVQTFHVMEKADISRGCWLGGSFESFVFPWPVDFSGTTFPNGADFTRTTFSCWSDFTGAKFISEDDSDPRGEVYFSEARFSNSAYFTRVTFSSLADFTGATFSGWVDFTGAEFLGKADFTGATFSGGVPLFRDASFHQGAIFGDIDKSFIEFRSDEAEENYRLLRLAMGEQQALRKAADFAALQLKAHRYRRMREAKTKPFWERIPLWVECLGYLLWEKCSKSGRSFVRPFVGYLASLLTFTASYVLPCQGWFGDWWTGFRYAFLKQLSIAAVFRGALRGSPNRVSELEKTLFGTNLPPGWVDVLNSVQAIITFALFFLMYRGIRYFLMYHGVRHK